MKFALRTAILAAGLSAVFAAPAPAGELAGVILPDRMTVEGSPLELNGMGPREATWLRIKVYVAGLYLEAKSSDADAILRADGPKQIVFVFVRSVSRKRILREWNESLEANIGKDFASLRDRVATLHAWMPETVGHGDRMSFTYLPGNGVVVEIQGSIRGTIPGADFARALFSMWLGANPPNQSLRTGLLGRG